jgi:two-component system chemotaxis sensor kinase CheA
MITKEEEVFKKLQAMFQVEAEEHINVLSSGLIELEKNPKNKTSLKLIETIFREVHSLKGAASSVNRKDIESLCQVLESLFAKLKNKQIYFSAGQFDLVHKSLDTLSKMISGTGSKSVKDDRELIKQLQSITDEDQSGKKKKEQTTIFKKRSEEIKQNAQPVNGVLFDKELVSEEKPSKEIAQGALPAKRESAPAESVDEKPLQLETVRIQTSKLDPLFLQAEQMIQSKIASVQRTVELKGICNFVGAWKTELRKLEARRSGDNGLQVKEIINWTNEQIDETERNIFTVTHAIESDQRSLGRMIDDHVESMKNILMLPVSTIIEVFPRLVRDLSRSQGKEVELITHGKEIEVDKRILEELKDPLIHLLRNCIDHGIMKPEKRLELKKPSHGTITLTFVVIDGRNLEIRISDDGAGINSERVISAAVKTGVVSKEHVEKISTQESLDLIFKSGITTSPMITDISGRGLGLAIVREKVENLGGKVFVESQPDIGTTFRLFLPLSLSTVRGVLVKTAEHFFIIPTGNVERALRVSSEEIKTVENRETILIGQEIIWIIKLSDVLGLHDRTRALSSQKGKLPSSPHFIQIVVLTQGNYRIGFKVDEIIDEHQILVKKLGRQLKSVRNISGAAVLGSGTVVPVINVSDLMKSALDSISMKRITKNEIQAEVKVYKVLVTDDSITSRTLIKNILETAGYDVITAVDGVDAVTKALVGEFDLIVSDVDMPRMNGFELTAKIRKDKKLSEVPVVLVTALESREDREHGIDVGANAYIVKSSFDQSNLLEVIKKLL